MACAASFTLRVAKVADAAISIEGTYPIDLYAGAQYNIRYTYVRGDPPAHAFGIDWTAEVNQDFIDVPPPSFKFSPLSPQGKGGELRVGYVSGVVPELSYADADIIYSATVWIRQA